MSDAGLSAQENRPAAERSGWFEVRYEEVENVAGKETVVRGTIVVDPLGRQRSEFGPDWSRPDEGWVIDSKTAVYVDASRALPSRVFRWVRRLLGMNPEIVLGRTRFDAPEHVIATNTEVEQSFTLKRPPEEESDSNSSFAFVDLGKRELAGVVCQGICASRPGGDFSEQWLPVDHPLSRSVRHFYSEALSGERRTIYRVMSVTEIEPRPHLFAVLSQ